MRALGLMTGTALDGFTDAAIVESNGETICALGAWGLYPYGDALRERLARAVGDARAWEFAGAEPASFAAVERDYTLAQADAVRALVKQAGLHLSDIDVVGLHGITVLHRPTLRRTRQLGDGALLARELGVDVVFDLRSTDVAAGGEGAPLAPIYHAAAMRWSNRAAPSAALNLGGVANVTWWNGDDDIAAFDTGPANGPLNEWVEQHGLGAYDKDGTLAAHGRVHEDVIARALMHPFFAQPFPKSLDRFDFNAGLVAGLSPEDGAATLTAFAAAALARSLELLPSRPRELIVCGGGRKNPTLMREITTRTGAATINGDAIGWRGDAIEAEAIAFLATRTLRGLPLSFPRTTGVAAPLTGGRIARA